MQLRAGFAQALSFVADCATAADCGTVAAEPVVVGVVAISAANRHAVSNWAVEMTAVVASASR